jgi:GcrA cell cycle regulator
MPSAPNDQWPNAYVNLLRQLLPERLSASQIAAELNKQFRTNITRNAVIGKAYRLGLKLIGGKSTPGTRRPRIRKRRVLAPRCPLLPPPVAPPEPFSPAPVAAVLPEPEQCHWPLGEPGDPSFGYCNMRAEPGRPYCSDHGRVARVHSRAYRTNRVTHGRFW